MTDDDPQTVLALLDRIKVLEAALGVLMESISTRDLPRWEKEPSFIQARAALEEGEVS